MEKVGKLFNAVKGKFSGDSYQQISTLDPNEAVADRLRTSKSHGRIAKPLETHAGHSDTINTMVVVRSGMILSGGKDGRVVLTNTDSGELHSGWNNMTEVNKICYRNYVANHSLIAGGRDGTLRHWMFNGGSPDVPSTLIDGHEFGVTGVVSIDEHQFISGSRDCTVKLWDLERAQCVISQYVNRNLITHMTYNCTNNLVAQTSEDKSVRLWDPRSMAPVIEFPRKSHIQMHCEFDGPDRLFSCSNGFNTDGCEITSYDLRNNRLSREVRGHEGNVTCLAIVQLDAARKFLVSVAGDKQVRLWKLEEDGLNVLKPVWSQDVPLNADNLQVCTYPDGHIIVSGGKGRLIHYQAKVAAQRVLLEVQLIQSLPALKTSASSHVIR